MGLASSIPSAGSATTAKTASAAAESASTTAPATAAPPASTTGQPQPAPAEGGEADHDQGNDRRDRGDDKRSGEQPCRTADERAAGNRTADIAENRAQDRSECWHRNQKDERNGADVKPARRSPATGLFLRRRVGSAHDGDDAIHTGVDPRRELTSAEKRRHRIADDAPSRHIRQLPFQAVADLDAHLL